MLLYEQGYPYILWLGLGMYPISKGRRNTGARSTCKLFLHSLPHQFATILSQIHLIIYLHFLHTNVLVKNLVFELCTETIFYVNLD